MVVSKIFYSKKPDVNSQNAFRSQANLITSAVVVISGVGIKDFLRELGSMRIQTSKGRLPVTLLQYPGTKIGSICLALVPTRRYGIAISRPGNSHLLGRVGEDPSKVLPRALSWQALGGRMSRKLLKSLK
jgi:hypothetical protein